MFASNLPFQYESKIVDVDGLSRKYLVHLPSNLSPKYPVVLFLHGAGGTAEGALNHYGWVEKSDQESFIAVFPEATPIDLSNPPNFRTNPNVWNDGSGSGKERTDDISFLKKVINDVLKEYWGDPNRVYITGFSNGASMTFRAGIELSDSVKAIAPVSGHLWQKYPKPKKLMSLLLITGDADPLNPLEGGAAKNIWNVGKEKRPSMKESIKIWLGLLGIGEGEKKVKQENGITKVFYGPNKTGLEVIYMIIRGQGHEWPGKPRVLPEFLTGNNVLNFSATDTIWDFFKSQR